MPTEILGVPNKYNGSPMVIGNRHFFLCYVNYFLLSTFSSLIPQKKIYIAIGMHSGVFNTTKTISFYCPAVHDKGGVYDYNVNGGWISLSVGTKEGDT